MNEITSEKANNLLKMFQFLSTREYNLYYEDNAFKQHEGYQTITYPCSLQRFVLKDKRNRDIAELKQKNGVFYYRES